METTLNFPYFRNSALLRALSRFAGLRFASCATDTPSSVSTFGLSQTPQK
ncbi:MAG TPA: hypothetical protein P5257_08780 [Bacteroidales bacterium]|nr:hypothetical protein [Bacteroidales bacterium]HRT90199.1 hypothetical protein [Bacteroidales bacterium]